MEAYCMKCRTKREIQSPSQVTFKNGRPATQGTCAVCGTKLFRYSQSSAPLHAFQTFRKIHKIFANTLQTPHHEAGEAVKPSILSRG